MLQGPPDFIPLNAFRDEETDVAEYSGNPADEKASNAGPASSHNSNADATPSRPREAHAQVPAAAAHGSSGTSSRIPDRPSAASMSPGTSHHVSDQLSGLSRRLEAAGQRATEVGRACQEHRRAASRNGTSGSALLGEVPLAEENGRAFRGRLALLENSSAVLQDHGATQGDHTASQDGLSATQENRDRIQGSHVTAPADSSAIDGNGAAIQADQGAMEDTSTDAASATRSSQCEQLLCEGTTDADGADIGDPHIEDTCRSAAKGSQATRDQAPLAQSASGVAAPSGAAAADASLVAACLQNATQASTAEGPHQAAALLDSSDISALHTGVNTRAQLLVPKSSMQASDSSSWMATSQPGQDPPAPSLVTHADGPEAIALQPSQGQSPSQSSIPHLDACANQGPARWIPRPRRSSPEAPSSTSLPPDHVSSADLHRSDSQSSTQGRDPALPPTDAARDGSSLQATSHSGAATEGSSPLDTSNSHAITAHAGSSPLPKSTNAATEGSSVPDASDSRAVTAHAGSNPLLEAANAATEGVTSPNTSAVGASHPAVERPSNSVVTSSRPAKNKEKAPKPGGEMSDGLEEDSVGDCLLCCEPLEVSSHAASLYLPASTRAGIIGVY